MFLMVRLMVTAALAAIHTTVESASISEETFASTWRHLIHTVMALTVDLAADLADRSAMVFHLAADLLAPHHSECLVQELHSAFLVSDWAVQSVSAELHSVTDHMARLSGTGHPLVMGRLWLTARRSATVVHMVDHHFSPHKQEG